MTGTFRNLLTKFSFTNLVFLRNQTKKQKKRQLRLSRKLENNLGIKFHTVEDLKKLIFNYRKGKSSAICHIIGSGWSLNESIGQIANDDFVIGFNQAAISGIKFDLYFVEFGSKSELEVSEKQLKLVKEVVSKQTDLIFFKNVWARRNSLEYIQERWARNVRYIQDIPTNCFNANFLKHSLDIFLEEDPIFMRQYSSTALTMIKLGKDLGFKSIVLHGVDFGGEYFFDSENFVNSKDLKRYLPDRVINNMYRKSHKEDIHSTSKDFFGLKYSLPYIKEYMNKKGVDLYSAASVSPLSKILPIYRIYSQSQS